MKIKIVRLSHKVQLPERKTIGSVGYDLSAFLPDNIVTIPPNEICLIPTGLSMEIPEGYDAEIRPRSGLSTKHKILIPNSPGTIDSDYRGEIKIPLLNFSSIPFDVSNGLRIAQMIFRKSIFFEFEDIAEFDTKTIRDSKGFGSTGNY